MGVKTLRPAVCSINMKMFINSGVSQKSLRIVKYRGIPVSSEIVDERREHVRSWYFAPIFLSMTVLFLVTALTVILLYWNFYQKKEGKFLFEQ